MGRNTEKNAYFSVSLPRNSHTLKKLMQDATETGISLSQLIALRVSDWYRWETRQMAESPTAALLSEQAVQEEAVEVHHALAASNAAAALDAWF